MWSSERRAAGLQPLDTRTPIWIRRCEGDGFGRATTMSYEVSERRGESRLLIPSDPVMRAESHPPPPRRCVQAPSSSSSSRLCWKRICTKRELTPEHGDDARRSRGHGAGLCRHSSSGDASIQILQRTRKETNKPNNNNAAGRGGERKIF